MSRPPADWLPQVAALIHARPELEGVGVADVADALGGA